MAEVFILLILIIVNGLFVMSEIALVSARKGRLDGQQRRYKSKSSIGTGRKSG